jgi:pyruvate dehydrogenase complex dehydrogenase (E1) component
MHRCLRVNIRRNLAPSPIAFTPVIHAHQGRIALQHSPSISGNIHKNQGSKSARNSLGNRTYGTKASAEELDNLKQLEKKIIWLSTYMIHNANVLREKRDGLKVGGHPASSSSLSTVMAALYFHFLRPHDRVAVKPHASPMFHAIHYLFGKQSLDQMQRFRGKLRLS